MAAARKQTQKTMLRIISGRASVGSFYRRKSSSSSSSAWWLRRQRNDPYVHKAHELGYRARSAFKLLEIDRRHKILRPGMTVVECGAAPGTWTQVAAAAINAGGAYGHERCRSRHRAGIVVGCDLLHVDPVPGAQILSRADFTSEETQGRILVLLGGRKADLLLRDMAPNASGVGTLNSSAQLALAARALHFAVLNSASSRDTMFLCKVWSGAGLRRFVKTVGRFYESVEECKPNSSRNEYAELFELGRGLTNRRIKTNKSAKK